jgi:transposase
MIEITPHTRVLAAIDSVDGRKGIDGLSQVCRSVLKSNPMSGTIFAFRNRNRRAIKLLMYDGQGFWLAMKRLSQGKFLHWPSSPTDEAGAMLLAHQFRALLFGGDHTTGWVAPMWRRVPLESELRAS